jgi:tryptophan-rich sensory protein
VHLRDGVAWLCWVGVVVAAGASVGVLFSPGAWYEGLAKPTWHPPSWLFGPVWTLLYALLGTGVWLVSREPGPAAEVARPQAWLAFGVQAVLNLAWTPLFFGLRSPAWAFVDIVLLWGAVLWMTLAFGRTRPLAGTLQVPLVAWVSFALVLNGTLWLMN